MLKYTDKIPTKQTARICLWGMVGLHVIEYLLRVPWVWGFPWGFQWGFLWLWDGYGINIPLRNSRSDVLVCILL